MAVVILTSLLTLIVYITDLAPPERPLEHDSGCSIAPAKE